MMMTMMMADESCGVGCVFFWLRWDGGMYSLPVSQLVSYILTVASQSQHSILGGFS